jgi:hypothetical protein
MLYITIRYDIDYPLRRRLLYPAELRGRTADYISIAPNWTNGLALEYFGEFGGDV